MVVSPTLVLSLFSAEVTTGRVDEDAPLTVGSVEEEEVADTVPEDRSR